VLANGALSSDDEVSSAASARAVAATSASAQIRIDDRNM
jgi:hypothetical protein